MLTHRVRVHITLPLARAAVSSNQITMARNLSLSLSLALPLSLRLVLPLLILLLSLLFDIPSIITFAPPRVHHVSLVAPPRVHHVALVDLWPFGHMDVWTLPRDVPEASFDLATSYDAGASESRIASTVTIGPPLAEETWHDVALHAYTAYNALSWQSMSHHIVAWSSVIHHTPHTKHASQVSRCRVVYCTTRMYCDHDCSQLSLHHITAHHHVV